MVSSFFSHHPPPIFQHNSNTGARRCALLFGVAAMVCWLVDGGGAMTMVRYRDRGWNVVVVVVFYMRSLLISTRSKTLVKYVGVLQYMFKKYVCSRDLQ